MHFADAEENYVSYYDDVTTSDDDDTLILPGNADDEVDIEYLMTKLFLGSANTGSTVYLVLRRIYAKRRVNTRCPLWAIKFYKSF